MEILTLKQAKKIIIFIVGITILLFGILLIFMPGPAFIIIPVGLVVLATEFLWAKKLLKSLKSRVFLKH